MDGVSLPKLKPPKPTGHKHIYTKFAMKLSHLIHRNIVKIVATRGQILTQKCTKIDFGWGFSPDPVGGAYSTHQIP